LNDEIISNGEIISNTETTVFDFFNPGILTSINCSKYRYPGIRDPGIPNPIEKRRNLLAYFEKYFVKIK
jgi:hypothetical protein